MRETKHAFEVWMRGARWPWMYFKKLYKTLRSLVSGSPADKNFQEITEMYIDSSRATLVFETGGHSDAMSRRKE